MPDTTLRTILRKTLRLHSLIEAASPTDPATSEKRLTKLLLVALNQAGVVRS